MDGRCGTPRHAPPACPCKPGKYRWAAARRPMHRRPRTDASRPPPSSIVSPPRVPSAASRSASSRSALGDGSPIARRRTRLPRARGGGPLQSISPVAERRRASSSAARRSSRASSSAASRAKRRMASMAPGLASSRIGSTRSRTRLRRKERSALEGSRRYSMPAWSSQRRSRARRSPSSGRMTSPRRAGMPRAPARPLPRSRLISTVSASSSAVCAVAIRPPGVPTDSRNR
jgi:hypothetical protein